MFYNRNHLLIEKGQIPCNYWGSGTMSWGYRASAVTSRTQEVLIQWEEIEVKNTVLLLN